MTTSLQVDLGFEVIEHCHWARLISKIMIMKRMEMACVSITQGKPSSSSSSINVASISTSVQRQTLDRQPTPAWWPYRLFSLAAG